GEEGEEVPDVVGAALGDPEQVHPRGEDRSGAGQDEGADVLGGAVELARQGVEQLDVQGARLPVRQAEGEDAFVLRTCDHLVASEPTGAPVHRAAERPARRPRPMATRNPAATADRRGLLQHLLWYLARVVGAMPDGPAGRSAAIDVATSGEE